MKETVDPLFRGGKKGKTRSRKQLIGEFGGQNDFSLNQAKWRTWLYDRSEKRYSFLAVGYFASWHPKQTIIRLHSW